jgi:hypothetical protein
MTAEQITHCRKKVVAEKGISWSISKNDELEIWVRDDSTGWHIGTAVLWCNPTTIG